MWSVAFDPGLKLGKNYFFVFLQARVRDNKNIEKVALERQPKDV